MSRSNYSWYMGNGRYIEGTDAYEHVAEYNSKLIEAMIMMKRGLHRIIEYIDEAEAADEGGYEELCASALNIGEVCATAIVMMEVLIEETEERMEENEQ